MDRRTDCKQQPGLLVFIRSAFYTLGLNYVCVSLIDFSMFRKEEFASLSLGNLMNSIAAHDSRCGIPTFNCYSLQRKHIVEICLDLLLSLSSCESGAQAPNNVGLSS